MPPFEFSRWRDNAAAFATVLSSAAPVIVSTITLYEIARYTTRVADQAAADQFPEFLRKISTAGDG